VHPELTAVVPIKDMADAKQRLAGVLSPTARRALFRVMVEDVLDALAACPGLAGILVVTRDAEAVALAERYGARVVREARNVGHTAASSLGARTLAREEAPGMIQIPGDLPLLTPADIEAVIMAHGEAPAVTIAPSHDERGSNAVACSPPDLLPLAFGDDSFLPHLERARALGVEPAVVRMPGLALDVDTPSDLERLMTLPPASRAQAYLAGLAAGDQP
jgi:2-phospho-L-lactate guanylyltransferase